MSLARIRNGKVATALAVLFVANVLLPSIAFAHQPRIASENPITVTDPEISKAYYGTLGGEPVVYRITALEAFDLYVNVLVPDIAGQKKDVSAAVIKNGDTATPVAVLEGTNFEWKQLFEEFGHDSYWQGPEYKARVEAGTYEIRVWSSNNDSKYSLAIGEIEAFDLKESLNAYKLIPQIKRDFFNKSPATFIFSPLGYGLIIVMVVLAFAFGFAYRFILKKFASSTGRGVPKNIGRGDRVLRFAIAVFLFVWAITTTWSPLLLFFSGFALFEAIFSWCGFYAALGRNSCPIT